MPLADVKHVFVLMLENRSFDHILGAVPLNGVDINGSPISADGIAPGVFQNQDGAGNTYFNTIGGNPSLPMAADPPHEYDDVVTQLLGDNRDTPDPANPGDLPYNYTVRPILLNGFVRSFESAGANPLGTVLQSFPENSVPNLARLAQTYCVCDRWFSSLPGPTVPNRFFLVAGTSGGNPKSPPDVRLGTAEFLDAFHFKNGNIFQRIKHQTPLSFRIFRGDSFPFSTLLDGVDYDEDTVAYSPQVFAAGCDDPHLPDFVFIEPKYDIIGSYRAGNSQHPLGTVQAGDQLIGEIYTTLSNSKCWESSVLIITYDEHGGFFDHVPPPKAVAPGDVPDVYDFHFTQLGVRVPAVIVSPLLVRRNLVEHTLYDHTSILATLREVFPELGALGSFTMRDRMANTLSHLFDGPAADLAPTPL